MTVFGDDNENKVDHFKVKLRLPLVYHVVVFTFIWIKADFRL